jgi:hypothetical protein
MAAMFGTRDCQREHGHERDADVGKLADVLFTSDH